GSRQHSPGRPGGTGARARPPGRAGPATDRPLRGSTTPGAPGLTRLAGPVQAGQRPRDLRRLGPRAAAQLPVDDLEVELEGVDGVEQLLRDLAQGEPAREHPQDRELTLGQGLDRYAG